MHDRSNNPHIQPNSATVLRPWPAHLGLAALAARPALACPAYNARTALRPCPGMLGPTIQALAQAWRPYRPIFPSRTAFWRRSFRPRRPSGDLAGRSFRPGPYRLIFPSRTPFWRPYRSIFPSRTTSWRPYKPTFLSKDHILIEFVFEILDLTCMADLHTSSSTNLRNNFCCGSP